MKYVSVFALLVLLVAGCGQETPPAEEAAQPTEAELMARENPAGTYGAAITETAFVTIPEILDDPEAFEGKTVMVSGTVNEVCPQRGCWIDLAADESAATVIRYKVKDGEIVFPGSAAGHTAIVQGQVERLEFDEKAARDYLAHMAEEKGESFDTLSHTGPLTIWWIKGGAAEIKG